MRRGPYGAGVHELALMESLVETVGEQAGAARVVVVRLEVGRGSCVAPDALRFCFDVCAQGTALEGATLEILRSDGDALRIREVEVI